MGERGPAKTPTRILQMRGSWRARARRDEPKPESGRPRCPRWLGSRARRKWREVVPHLASMRVLAKCDRNALARYCQLMAMWQEAQDWLRKHGTVYPEKDAKGRTVGIREYPQVGTVLRIGEQLLRLEKVFGLTPSARAGLAVPKTEGVTDPRKARFFTQNAG